MLCLFSFALWFVCVNANWDSIWGRVLCLLVFFAVWCVRGCVAVSLRGDGVLCPLVTLIGQGGHDWAQLEVVCQCAYTHRRTHTRTRTHTHAHPCTHAHTHQNQYTAVMAAAGKDSAGQKVGEITSGSGEGGAAAAGEAQEEGKAGEDASAIDATGMAGFLRSTFSSLCYALD